MFFRTSVIGGSMALAAACSPTTYLSVDRMLGDLERDEAATRDKLEGQTVSLQGKVTDKGITAAERSEQLARLGLTDAAVASEGDPAFAVLQGTTEQPGQVLCLFRAPARNGLSAVAEGQLATFSCELRQIARSQAGPVPIFDQCYVE